MLDCTDRHFRFLIRLITRRSLLYTEMLTVRDILSTTPNDKLKFNPIEHPIVLQVGGSDPDKLASCAVRVADEGYDAINLNVGCPSQSVQQGAMGACLMLQPQLVAECVYAMKKAVEIPVTVKCRLGVDDQDSYENLHHFIENVAQAGCATFIIHARKAWLKGLSPKENRQIPALEYDKVYRIKKDFPHLEIIINGGITSLELASEQLHFCDGVMIGRAAYSNPYLMSKVDNLFYDSTATTLTQEEVVLAFSEYVKDELEEGVKLSKMTRHLLGLFQGYPKSSHWRRHLSCNSSAGTSVGIIQTAMATMSIAE